MRAYGVRVDSGWWVTVIPSVYDEPDLITTVPDLLVAGLVSLAGAQDLRRRYGSGTVVAFNVEPE